MNSLKVKTPIDTNNDELVKLLDDYHIQVLALDMSEDQCLVQLFRSQPAWSVDFEDDQIILFTRANPSLSIHIPT